jgi:O-antigen/teichoic acid export membrane protein
MMEQFAEDQHRNGLEMGLCQSLFNKQKILTLWDSPTLMTFGSFTANALKLLLVLPLILTRLATPDIAIWYLFAAIITLENLADIGFCPTFSRLIAYAMAGANVHSLSGEPKPEAQRSPTSPNWETIEIICTNMGKVYDKLTVLLMLLLLSLGTISLIKPIAASPAPMKAWISWGIVLLTSAVFLRGNAYRAFLEGTNQIALIRRWDIYTAAGAAGTSIAALLAGAGLLGLVLSQQGWMALNVLRNRYLCRIFEGGRYKYFKKNSFSSELYHAAWPSAWRSGLGIFLSQGMIQASGIAYAQLETSGRVASYLFGLRLVQAVSQFSQAPFYSKLPMLARLRAADKIDDQRGIAQRGMKLSYWSFLVAFVGIGMTATPLFSLIQSNADFPDPLMWSMLGIATFAERFGAMHIQLYGTTNHIIWHIANGVGGFIYLTASIILYPFLGVYSFPVGMIAGNLLFYDWYSASHSYKAFGMRFWQFEKKTALAPMILMIIFVLFYLLRV